MENVEWMKKKHKLKMNCQSQCNKNAEDLQEKLWNKKNFNGMEQTSHSFGQCCIVLLIMTYVRNMPQDIKENYRNHQNKQKRKKL
jgi:galactokinase